MIDHIDRKEVEYWNKKLLRDAGLVTPRRRTNACYDEDDEEYEDYLGYCEGDDWD